VNRFKIFFQKVFPARIFTHQWVCFALLGLGIVLRLKHYLNNCSFWTDEAWVAVSVTSRPLTDILRGIDIFPEFSKPPLGFLLLVKTASLAIGNNEYILRLFPFVFGLGSLFLFYRLVRKINDKALTAISLGFFAFCPSLIYYSAELKQYSCDLFFGLVLSLIFIDLVYESINIKKAVFLAFLGAVVVWISNATLFILAGFSIAIFLLALEKKQLKNLAYLVFAYALWAVSFWFLYRCALSNMVTNEYLFQSWPGALLEHSLLSKEGLAWLGKIFLAMFADPLDFSLTGTAFIFFILGVVALWREKRQSALVFFFPIFVTLLAAVLHKYPFRGRLLLFLFPAVSIFVIKGMLELTRKIKKEFSFGILVALSLVLFADPLLKSAQGLVKDYCRQDNREAMEFLNSQYKPGDFVFMNSAAQFPFWYYGSRLKMARFFEQTWAGRENGVIKKGVKIGKFWEGSRRINGRNCLLFRYEFNFYNENYCYVKSLIKTTLTPEDISLVIEGFPFNHPVEGKRVWIVLGDSWPLFEKVVTGSFGLRFPKILEFRKKGISLYLYQVQ